MMSQGDKSWSTRDGFMSQSSAESCVRRNTTVVIRRGQDMAAASPSSITNTTLNSSIVVADVIKQQERQIQELKAALAVFNQEKYTPMGGARGKNFTRGKQKVTLTKQDQLNKHSVDLFIREYVWPSQKILPTNWQKYRNECNSLSRLILDKVTLPHGVDDKTYWDGMLVGIANDKFCSLRANFKQELFEQFQGMCHLLCIVISKFVFVTQVVIFNSGQTSWMVPSK